MSTGRSSSASSFSALNDVESEFDGSIIDRSISRTSTIGGAEIDEMDKLRMRIALLELENKDRMQQKAFMDLEVFKISVSGEWEFVSSTNVEKFLEKQNYSDLEEIVFQVASKHFNFNGNTLFTFDQVGSKKFNAKTVELSKCEFSADMAHVSFVSDNRLKIIQLGKDGVESIRKEVFVSEDGQLHVILKAFGVECTRVYQKMGDKSTTENRDNLRKLQQEHYELKEKYVTDIAKLEKALEMEKKSSQQCSEKLEKKITELTTENAKLKEIKEKEREDIVKLQETLEMEQKNSEQRERELEKKNDELTTEVAKLKEIREKELKKEQPYGRLAEVFNGYWKVEIEGYDCMIRIEGNQFIQQSENESEPTFYTFGVEEYSQIVKVVGSEIRHQRSNSAGAITWERVYKVENGKLKFWNIVIGLVFDEYTYEQCVEFPQKYFDFLAKCRKL